MKNEVLKKQNGNQSELKFKLLVEIKCVFVDENE